MNDEEIMSVSKNENEEYKKLKEEHKKLEQSLEEINKKKYLTPDEEIEKKRIQKQKLQFKDRMAQIIRDHNQ